MQAKSQETGLYSDFLTAQGAEAAMKWKAGMTMASPGAR